MKIAIVTTDNREHFKTYDRREPDIPTPQAALVQGFAALPDIEVHIISCLQQPVLSPEKLASNIFFHSLYVSKIGWMRTLYQGCVRAVRRKLKEIQPDIVHGQGTERDCAISAVFSGFPNVVTIHGNMAELARLFKARAGSFDWMAARLENFTLKRTAGVFCNSEYTESLVKPRAKKTWHVPNGLRESFFIPSKSKPLRSKCVLLNVGVISPRKRQVELLKIISELRNVSGNFEFHFIGLIPDTDYGREFQQKIKPLGEAGIAHYLGMKSTEELISCFDSATALVHFPSEEAFGLVVAEALARDLKFFGSRLGGIVDIAQDAPGAELFSRDDWNGLTGAIAKWIEHGHPIPQGANAFIRERYSPEIIARRHMEIYRELLSSRARA